MQNLKLWALAVKWNTNLRKYHAQPFELFEEVDFEVDVGKFVRVWVVKLHAGEHEGTYRVETLGAEKAKICNHVPPHRLRRPNRYMTAEWKQYAVDKCGLFGGHKEVTWRLHKMRNLFREAAAPDLDHDQDSPGKYKSMKCLSQRA